MRVAVWRYGMGTQTDGESKVGGGRIARALVETLVKLGHEVTILGSVSSSATMNLLKMGADVQPQIVDLQNDLKCDAAVLLTGPFNVMYGKPVFDTYARLSSLRGKAIYAQWDVALPFHFYPEKVKRFAASSAVNHESLMEGKEWTILAQISEKHARSKMGESVGYSRAKYNYGRCFWELAELEGEPLLPSLEAIPAIGYFGSDRPGRIRELKRWFGHSDSPPVHIYGQWGEKTKAEFSKFNNIAFMGKISENEVRKKLNSYLMTFHMADPAYVKTDFIAQRFIENAMACVPTYYSDHIQPSVKAVISEADMSDLMVSGRCSLSNAFDRLRSDDSYRIKSAITHQTNVLKWASESPFIMHKVLEGLLA